MFLITIPLSKFQRVEVYPRGSQSIFKSKIEKGKILDYDSVVFQKKRELNKVLKEYATKKGIEIIDLEDHFLRVQREESNFFYDKWHFTKEGAVSAAPVCSE